VAGPELTTYLQAQDFESFRRLVRHYNHDMANRLSRITTECSILSRIAERVAPEEILVDPAQADEIKRLAVEAKTLVDNVSNVREFFYPAGDTEGNGLKQYAPFDATGWDAMTGAFTSYLVEKLQPIEPLFAHLAELEVSGLIKPDGRGKAILVARESMSKSVGEMEDLLTSDEWDKLLPEWLDRPE